MLWIMLGAMILLFWIMSRSTRKRQEAERQRMERSLAPGTWVMTRSGMYGRVVDVDGDVVILETHDGVETMWDKIGIYGEKKPPFAADSEAPAEELAEDLDAKENNEEKDNPTESESK